MTATVLMEVVKEPVPTAGQQERISGMDVHQHASVSLNNNQRF